MTNEFMVLREIELDKKPTRYADINTPPTEEQIQRRERELDISFNRLMRNAVLYLENYGKKRDIDMDAIRLRRMMKKM